MMCTWDMDANLWCGKDEAVAALRKVLCLFQRPRDGEGFAFNGGVTRFRSVVETQADEGDSPTNLAARGRGTRA